MKTNLHKTYKTDIEKEKSGVWWPEDAGDKEPAFLVRRFNATNPRAKGAMAKYFKPYARQVETDTLSVEKATEININLFLDVCLVDWKNVVIDGVDAPYTRETGLKLMQELPDLFQDLWKFSGEYKNFREDLGNY